MKKRVFYLLMAVAFLSSCKKQQDVFQPYSNTTVPVKLGEGTLSTDSIQWNNVYVAQTHELFYTKMGKSASVINKLDYSDGTFKGLETIQFPEGIPHTDIYLDEKGEFMLFSSLMPEFEGDTISDWNIWKSIRKGGKWQDPDLFYGGEVEENLFYPWLTASGNLYFSLTPHESRNSDLYVSKLINGEYQKPEALPKYINSQKLEGDAFIAPDESYLIFAGFERGQNIGKSDLYISYNMDGTWSAPVWLGDKINSDGYDGSPFVTQDGKYLIFTSSRDSTDDDTFFNHYIVPFDSGKFKDTSLRLENYLVNVGVTPIRLEVDNLTTSGVEYGGSLSMKNGEIFYTRATEDFSERQITRSRFVNGIFSEPERVKIGGEYYTDASDVQITENGDYLYFKMRGNVPDDVSRRDGNIWRSKSENGVWSKAELLPSEINSELSEYYPMITNSGNLYFSREYEDTSYDIYVSRFEDGKYQEAERLPNHINTNLLESDAYVSPDETYMVFVRMYAEEGLGVSDLYISFQEDNAWSHPKNMRSLNSNGVDGSPFVTADGKYLIFTSTRDSENPEVFDGHLDIYAVRFDKNNWK
ncbi:TolB family protein [Flagellimonas nanhaiensis]|uniref:Uncharacterized protein n=1 Tax=Flagellimonas nanhaiensis TaxID=2292706 RepID=A0A371JLA0_9FLAO|nr:PD40 domain-containing protein [Allomuricauda nanhaiensis]RDY57742.1 hypothetical protein DX873_17745 [Allomuricauda nanhaiensis]